MRHKAKLSTRQEILLLFLASHTEKIDPIRIMKGLFLFAQQAPDTWLNKEENYTFIPYNYGPCSFDVYHDLETLERWGYIRSTEIPGQSWKYYCSSSLGRRLATELENTYQPDMIDFIRELRSFVSELSFRRLLKTIYHHYPEYASSSVFQ